MCMQALFCVVVCSLRERGQRFMLAVAVGRQERSRDSARNVVARTASG